jgi:hypothetical protein
MSLVMQIIKGVYFFANVCLAAQRHFGNVYVREGFDKGRSLIRTREPGKAWGDIWLLSCT